MPCFSPKDRLCIDWKLICIFKCLSQAVGVAEFFSEYDKMSKLFCGLSLLPQLKIPSCFGALCDVDVDVYILTLFLDYRARSKGEIGHTQ